MKKFLLTSLLIASLNLFAQEKLVVEYESLMDMDMEFLEMKLNENGRGNVKEILNAFKDQMTKPNYYTLRLTADESEYIYLEKINNDQPTDSKVKVQFGTKGIVYKNLKENIIAETVDFPRDFILRDSIKPIEWKISRESKEILGYEVRKAEAVIDSTSSLIAWYAPKLAYKNGPANYGGLPGLILQLEEFKNSKDEKAKFIFTAISLKVDESKNQIAFPKKGKIMTTEEYNILIEEEMKRMREMHGGGVDKD